MFGRRSKEDDFDYHGKNIDELLELSEEEDVEKRKAAIEAMGDLDEQFDPIMDRLRDIESDDSDGGVRSAAADALSKLSLKTPVEEYASEESGDEGTGFDDEVGDSTLDAGEFDVESSMSQAEEDRSEIRAEGKGIRVVIRESNSVTMDNNGQKTDQGDCTGSIKVQNTGSTNRITGVDLNLSNISVIETDFDIKESNRIGVLAPGRENDWSFEYQFQKEIEPITITQEYYDPETGVSPNFLGVENKEFEAKIVVSNTSNETIYSIKGEKIINPAALVQSSSSSSGTSSSDGGVASFEIEEINAGDSAEIILKMTATLSDDMRSYEAGELKVTYEHKNVLTSGLEYSSIDGVSDIRQRVRRRQRETEPSFYDCEIILENRSEFVYDLNRFSVFAGNLESQQMVLDWDGVEATEDEREIVPEEKVAFEFVFESPDSTPTFGEHIDFSIQSDVAVASQTIITLPVSDLKFMAIEITKTFLDANDQEITEYELPSYVETRVPTLVTLTGVGTFPLEGLVIKDEIPVGFKAPDTTEILILRNDQDLDSDNFDISAEDDALVVNINHLEATDGGGLDENDTIKLKYSIVADNPEPREEPIQVQSHGEGFLYEDESSRVFADSEVEGLKLVVVHRRDDLDIGKYIQAIDHNGQDAYKISLEAENFGSSTVTLEIQDLIPQGFELVNGSIETSPDMAQYSDPSSAKDGMVHGWTFSNVEPESQINASYIVVESDESANPRKLQSVYKG